MTAAALAVDAGQTEVRAALVADGRGVAGAAAPGVRRLGSGVGPDEIADELLAAIRALGPLPEPRPPAAIGLSGFEAAGADDLARIATRLERELGAPPVAIATDGLSALLGAIGTRDGVVVAAGTGTACLGRRGPRFAKADGWGSLLGDAGSGFAIGRAGLDAALRHLDGRDGGSPTLAAAAEARFGPLDRLADTVHRAPVPTRAVAGFAPDVTQAARDGDDRAAAILAQAGRELAVTACAVLDRLFPAGAAPIASYAGRVFAAGAPLRDAFAAELAARRPDALLREPEADGLRGAALLATLAPALDPDPAVLWRRP